MRGQYSGFWRRLQTPEGAGETPEPVLKDKSLEARNRMIPRACTVMILIALGAPSARAEAPDTLLRYGRHLAQECTSCHRSDGANGAIPALAGRPATEIKGLLEDFRAGRKTNPVMVSVAKSLDDEQMAALAAYFAALPRPASSAGPPP